MHNNSIIHRDIKPENICFVNGAPGVGDGKIKIIDFGTAIKFSKGTQLKDKYGSPNYIAPEVITGNYNEKCDVWSAGIVLYVLLWGNCPFDANSDQRII